jgi:hypothetical protein
MAKSGFEKSGDKRTNIELESTMAALKNKQPPLEGIVAS